LSPTELTFAGWLNLQFAQTPNVFAKEIADAAEISPGYLSGLRKSRKENPSLEVAEEIAAAFADKQGLGPDAEAALKRAARNAASASAPWRQVEANDEGEEADAGRWRTLGINFGGRSR
jgi:transcriptional regulator with XRE-family HTH domain